MNFVPDGYESSPGWNVKLRGFSLIKPKSEPSQNLHIKPSRRVSWMMENEKRRRNFNQDNFYDFQNGQRQDQARKSRYEKPRQMSNINQKPKNSSSEEEWKKKNEQRPEHLQQPHEAELSSFQKAIMHNRMKEVEEFMARGMDVNCQFSSGWTALMYASNCAHPDVVACLLKNGADPNSHKDNYTSLMSACASVGSDELRVLMCVSQLLDHGTDVDLHDRYGMSPLMYAAREGRATVVQKLIENNAAVNIQDSKGNSALIWAAQRGHSKVIQCLLDASADVDLQKTDGTTALSIALNNKHDQVVELLKDLATPIKQDSASVSPISTDATMADSPSKSSEIVSHQILNMQDLSASANVPTQQLFGSSQQLSSSSQQLSSSSQQLSSSCEAYSAKPGSDGSGRKTDSAPVSASPVASASNKLASDVSGAMAMSNQGAVMSTPCGDLELFLMGLDLRDLIPLFHQRKMTFQEFLQMTESDLSQLGVFKADVQKRILDAINDTHKKKFKSASVPLGHYNKKISCSEGVAMLSNLKRHLGFAGSSVGYISDRINEDRRIVLDSPDPIHIRELCSSTETALTSVGSLYDELVGFRLQLQGINPGLNFTPDDLTSFKKVSKKSKVNWKHVLLLGGGALTCIMTISWFVKSGARPVVSQSFIERS